MQQRFGTFTNYDNVNVCKILSTKQASDLVFDLLLCHANMLARILCEIACLVFGQEASVHGTDEASDISCQPLFQLVILSVDRIRAMQPLQIFESFVESSEPIFNLVLFRSGSNTDELRCGVTVILCSIQRLIVHQWSNDRRPGVQI